ncbi:MAG: type IV secretory system conjugative DNA transfer family protein, partial [Oscillospiraceae bacterium]|nr:type IV secretory system conjugative DNA transfer family protein [Oscillospiraceae bacterium]
MKLNIKNIFWFIVGYFLVIWAVGKLTTAWVVNATKFGFDAIFVIIENLTAEITQRPLQILWTDRMVSTACIIATVAYLVGVFWYFNEKKTFMKGKEHGSADWGKHSDIAHLIDADDEKNILWTESEKMSLDSRKTRKNLNVCVIGGSGSGKTRFFVTPNLLQANTSFVITDPKGELLRNTAGMFHNKGYKVKVLNLVDQTHSCAYNPFVYIKDDKDVLKLIRTLIKNTTPPQAQQSDPFWEKAETALLCALVFYLYKEAPDDEQNFSMVMELLRAAEVREGQEDYESDLDRLFGMLEEKDPQHIALKQYQIFK